MARQYIKMTVKTIKQPRMPKLAVRKVKNAKRKA
jgi:hypothetical protein